MGRKRKRAAPSDDDTPSSDGDGDGSTQQLLGQRGTDEGLNDDMAYWLEILDNDWL